VTKQKDFCFFVLADFCVCPPCLLDKTQRLRFLFCTLFNSCVICTPVHSCMRASSAYTTHTIRRIICLLRSSGKKLSTFCLDKFSITWYICPMHFSMRSSRLQRERERERERMLIPLLLQQKKAENQGTNIRLCESFVQIFALFSLSHFRSEFAFPGRKKGREREFSLTQSLTLTNSLGE